MRPIVTLGNPDNVSYRPCCVYPVNVVTPVISNTMANGRPVAKAGDVLTPAPGFPVCKDTFCPPLERVIIAVSNTMVNGSPAASVGDLTNPASPRTILPSPTNTFVSIAGMAVGLAAGAAAVASE